MEAGIRAFMQTLYLRRRGTGWLGGKGTSHGETLRVRITCSRSLDNYAAGLGKSFPKLNASMHLDNVKPKFSWLIGVGSACGLAAICRRDSWTLARCNLD